MERSPASIHISQRNEHERKRGGCVLLVRQADGILDFGFWHKATVGAESSQGIP